MPRKRIYILKILNDNFKESDSINHRYILKGYQKEDLVDLAKTKQCSFGSAIYTYMHS